MKRTLHLTVTLLLLLSVITYGQTPVALGDYNPGPEDAFSRFDFTTVELDGGFLLLADDGQTGAELCILRDGSLSLVKDINPGTESSDIGSFTEKDGWVYFTAFDTINGGAIWRTDGTEAGTELVFDPDTTNATRNVDEMILAENGYLYFTYDLELYRTNGSEHERIGGPARFSAPFNYRYDYFTTYEDGVAFLYAESFADSISLFAATDTIRRLAATPEQDGSYTWFGLQNVRDGLIFSLVNSRPGRAQTGIYVYRPAADTLVTVTADDNIFIASWLPMNDSLTIGMVSGDGYYAFTGDDNPTKIYDGSTTALAAGQTITNLSLGDQLIWQVNGGSFQDDLMGITDGTPEGTRIIEELEDPFPSNIIATNRYVFFASGTSNGFQPILYYYDLETGETVEFYEAVERSLNLTSIIFVGVQGDLIYYISNLNPDTGRELYAIDPGLDLSTSTPVVEETLDLLLTPDGATVRDDRDREVRVNFFDLSGRNLGNLTGRTNQLFPYPDYRGVLVALFTVDGRTTARKITVHR
ncbi:hypothetical protein [Lewinella sp. W8]|uniref:hypothetical protein n=1 Tax=Lewinella sp. W8 TaxID=2528208 RepID=UPI0010679851|nr:hypothetical protein [Lewinella sp. W8]MTB53001.1 hypothetical protein [Lewinella sp. W8]